MLIEMVNEVTQLNKSKLVSDLDSSTSTNNEKKDDDSSKLLKYDSSKPVETQLKESAKKKSSSEVTSKLSDSGKNSSIISENEDTSSSSSFTDSSSSSTSSDSESESNSETVGESNKNKNKIQQCKLTVEDAENTNNAKPVDATSKKLVLLNPVKTGCNKNIIKANVSNLGSKIFFVNGGLLSKFQIKDTDNDNTKKKNINIVYVNGNLDDVMQKMKTNGIPIKSTALKPVIVNPNKSTSLDNNLELNNDNKNTEDVPIKVNNVTNLIHSLKYIQPTEVSCSAAPIDSNKSIMAKTMKKNIENRVNVIDNNSHDDFNQDTSESFVDTKNNSSSYMRTDSYNAESAAIIKARSEFIKCRKLLIETAIHPQVPKFVPRTYYKGPTFSCEECNDTFTSSSSLSNHKNRRSVLFTYACPTCCRTIEFFNRCTFLLHVRSHNEAVRACFLNISTIPAHKLNFRVLDYDRDKTEMSEFISSNTASVISSKQLRNNDDEVSDTKSSISNSLKNNTSTLGLPDDNNRDLKSYKKKKITKLFDLPMNNSDSKSEMNISSNACKVTKVKNTSDDFVAKKSRLSNTMTTEENINENAKNKSENKLKSSRIKRKLQGTDVLHSDNVDDRRRKISSSLIPAPNKKHKSSDENNICQPTTAKTDKNVSTQIRRSDMKVTTNKSGSRLVPEEIVLTSSSSEDEEVQRKNEDGKKVLCRDCHKEVDSLPAHYRGDNRPLKEFACESCKWFNPSRCALEAHQRSHSKTSPLICPDCGFFFSTQESFLIHVNRVCYYEAKTIRFQCPVCSSLTVSVAQFAEHLKKHHTREVFKCSVCITSSYSLPVVVAHMQKLHPEKNVDTILEGFRCMLCPSVLVSKSFINLHINKHVYSLQYLRYVYLCKICKNYACGKLKKFVKHQAVCRDKILVKNSLPTNTCSYSNSNKTKITQRKTSLKSVTQIKEKDPLSMEDWEADKLKEEYVPTAKICIMCQTTAMEEGSQSLFCRACVRYVNAEDSVNDSPSESDLLTVNNFNKDPKFPKRQFKCKLCKKYMNRDWPTITQHYEHDHHVDFHVRTGRAAKSSSENSRRKSSGTLAGNKSTHAKSETSAKYKCVKCGLQSNDRNEFHAHISEHKLSKDYQCLECGECFIVEPSLEKHLIVVHFIRNIKEYFEENYKKDDRSEEKSIDEKSVAENQCEVCMVQCDSKQNYDKHIRTHGMAFLSIQRKKAAAAASSLPSSSVSQAC